ncbi:endochitinase A [Carica papaya]|uniref:endochitinase A n=1 Tax=Carica papaya TaxID=3649 RepID=UPI000B8D1BBF|nr:endochitinase A [Carica papaya]
MARANKYTSINFNHILDKNLPTSSPVNRNNPQQPSSSSSSSSSSFGSYSSQSSFNSNSLYKNQISTTRAHGRMLVLTRPTPKPIATAAPSLSTSSSPSPSPSPSVSASPAADQLLDRQQNPQLSDQDRYENGQDDISLRPQGRTGASVVGSSPLLSLEKGKDAVPVVGVYKPVRFVPPHLRPGFMGKEERPGPEVFRGREQAQRQHQQGHMGLPSQYGEDARPKSGDYEKIRRGGESDRRPRSIDHRPSSSG